jgi:protein-disulfide isomerase
MDKRFWAFLIVIALILGGVFFIGNTKKAAAPASSKGILTEHVTGKGTTGVKLIEYGDFQCPACGSFYPALKQVTDTYGDQISFQFRNFPLYSIHPNAIAGARAAEAADMQGKYWQMHDKLYDENYTQLVAQNQNKSYSTWIDASDPVPLFNDYATSLGLNLTKFKQDYKSTAANDRIQADLAEGNKLGVDSTPTFYLDGKKISNPDPTLAAFTKVLNAEIVKKGGKPLAPTPSAGTPEATPAP